MIISRWDHGIRKAIFDSELNEFLIVEPVDEPLDPEKRQKEEATRKKFELLRFGELKHVPSELVKMNHWRYCYCFGVI